MTHRIVVTGHSGVLKRQAIDNFAIYIRRREPTATVEVIEIERWLKDQPTFRSVFLYGSDAYEKYKLWEASFRVALGEWEKVKPKQPSYTFLLSHLSFHSQSEFFSSLSWAFPLGRGEIDGSSGALSAAETRWGARNYISWAAESTLQYVTGGISLPQPWKERLERIWPARRRRRNRVGVPDLISSQPLLGFLGDEFRPTIFLNFYDNVFRTKEEIKGYHFRLNELMRWRNVEMMLTDVLANLTIPEDRRAGGRVEHVGPDGEPRSSKSVYPYEYSPAIALNHSCDMLYHLINSPEVPRVYLSFPISRPRKEVSGQFMVEVNHFREYMGSQFVCFDPLTVDEKPLEMALARWTEEVLREPSGVLERCRKALAQLQPEAYELEKIDAVLDVIGEKRLVRFDPMHQVGAWREPFAGRDRLAPQEGSGTLELNADEVLEIAARKVIPDLGGREWSVPQSEIEHQVTSRDLRLIDQADCVVVYRPTRGTDRWGTGGTRSEVEYAIEKKKPVIVIVDTGDGKLAEGPLPGRIGNVCRISSTGGLDDYGNREDVFSRAVREVLEELSALPHFVSSSLKTI